MLWELWSDVRYRIRSLARRRHLDRELDDESEAHLAREAARYERQGLPAREAGRQARLAFGDVQALKERTRDARGTALLESLFQDARQAARGFRNKPGFAVGVCLTLALGIGANAAAFSVVKAILLTPLPYPAADRLVAISAAPPGDPAQELAPTIPEYIAWRDHAPLFEAVATMGYVDGDLAGEINGAPADAIVILKCTASLFRVLGVTPSIGRMFMDAEDPIDTPSDVIVISHRLWQVRFGADPAILTRSVRIDRVTKTIVGVMPDGLGVLGRDIDVWAPVNWSHSMLQGSARGWPTVARLRPGVTIREAQARMDHLAGTSPDESGVSQLPPARLLPLHDALFGSYARPLAILEGMVGVVFLITCANVAGLLLVRATSRRVDLAIRSAVGAGRPRLIRQLLIEAVLLSTIGGLSALSVAWLLLQVLIASVPQILPRSADMVLDGQVVAFTAGISLLAVLLFGTAPALHASRTNGVEALQASRRHAMDPPSLRRLRNGLVVLQVSMAFVLLVGTGLLAVTLLRISANDLGGDPRGVVAFGLRFPPSEYRRHVGSYGGLPLVEVSPVPSHISEEVWKRMEAVPGVESAAVVNHVPFVGGGPAMTFAIEGRLAPVAPDLGAAPSASTQIVSPHYFTTMKIPLVRGRDFDERDTATAPWVVVINEAMARAVWPAGDPIGQRLRIDVVSDEQPREIIGVVADTRFSPLDRYATPALYTALTQQPKTSLAPYLSERLLMTFVARTSGDPLAIVPALRRLVEDVDPGRPASNFTLLDRVVARQTALRRYLLAVMGVFAAIATVLAAVGIYGVIAHCMGQRTREIGIRLALGADRSDVWRLALSQAGSLLAAGLALGAVLATALTRLISPMLWGVTSTDPPTYLGVSALIVVVGLAAAFAPIRRAVRIAPTVALRCE